MKKETLKEKEYWEHMMILIQGWAIIIMWYAPIFTKLGISRKDIKAHFKELVEAYAGEKIYLS